MSAFDRLLAGVVPAGSVAAWQAATFPDEAVPGLPTRSRASAVLALFTTDDDPELLFTERAATLRSHAGQVSFPGGRIDPGDASPQAAALREASEEVSLDPRSVEVIGHLPATTLTRAFRATVVVGAWPGEAALVPEPAEVSQILRYPVSRLASDDARRSARHPRGGMGPAFVLGDIVIWGFTAHLVDQLLTLGGWARHWDRSAVVEVPERFLRSSVPK